MVCSQCQETFSGGHTCPACGGRLLDVARVEVRREYLEDPELAFSIRYLYQVRRGMIVLFLGVMSGLFGLALCVQQAVLSESSVGWLWYVAGAGASIAGPFVAYLLGSMIVRSTRTVT